jgi:hypothetical protein
MLHSVRTGKGKRLGRIVRYSGFRRQQVSVDSNKFAAGNNPGEEYSNEDLIP